MLRSSCQRAFRSTTPNGHSISARPISPAYKSLQLLNGRSQTRSVHAISNPTLANIEKRWEGMPPEEQAELWMQLRDRMKVDWKEMTMQEKKASYWIAFGPHGPRALPPPDEGKKIFLYTMVGLVASAVIFGITHHFARGPASTMTKEWQEASEEHLKAQGSEVITGYKGMLVQSKPGKKES